MKTTEKLPPLRGLYVITHARPAMREDDASPHGTPPQTASPQRHEIIARAALKGGAKIIQLRDKTRTDDELLETARRIALLCHERGALFLINDRVDLAQKCGADGVHLGPDDMTPDEARRMLGENAIIGVSCGTVCEARDAENRGADYLGVGAIFATLTKSDAGAPIGLNALREIADATTLPVAAIGGVDAVNIALCLESGAQMACVVSAVCAAGDEAAMEAVTRLLAANF